LRSHIHRPAGHYARLASLIVVGLWNVKSAEFLLDCRQLAKHA
jgi:hypothetical protein